MNKNIRLKVCLLFLLCTIEVVYSQEKLNGFVITPDCNCPFTIRPGFGEYGFVLINTTLSDLHFDIPAAPRRLVASDFNMEKQQWILKIVPNDNNYKKYKITINSKGFKQGEIEVRVEQKASQCFDVDPLHENVTEAAAKEDMPQLDVSYLVKSKSGMIDRLYAKVNGIEYFVDYREDGDSDDFECFEIVEQADFDNNGITDALIKDTYCGNSFIDYYIVTCHESGCFSVSNSVAGYCHEIENWKGKKTIVITSSNEGMNYDIKRRIKERYVYKDGQLQLVESFILQSIVAEKDIKSSDFHNGNETKQLRLSFDLDENGVVDYFVCTFWDRWDNLVIRRFVLNGKEVKDNYFGSGILRIGVLSSITNGYHDLVIDENNIIKWNGKKYVFPKRK